MFSPIELMNQVHGERAWISLPMPTNSETYDPTAAEDFEPAPAVYLEVLGHIGGKELVKGSNEAATGAFTIEATYLPALLRGGESHLLRGGTSPETATSDLLIIDYRERRHLGKIDGYTLFTAG